MTDRTVTLTPLSAYEPESVQWMWRDYVPLGEMTLLAGREGLGKSTVAYDVAAKVTQGQLPGIYKGEPKSVIICATEDSLTHTILPRLMAAGADTDHVFHVEVTDAEDLMTGLRLPLDNVQLEDKVKEVDAALILLDPLLGLVEGRLDTHKDAEVRQALEPIVAIAHRTESSIIGIIHVNKSQGRDTGDSIMGSRAFNAVTRSTLFIVSDPEDRTTYTLGLTKTNLGKLTVPGFTYQIEDASLGNDAKGYEIVTGRVVWGSAGTGNEYGVDAINRLRAGGEGGSRRRTGTQVAKAQMWLFKYLREAGGPVERDTVMAAGEAEGFNVKTIQRAAKQLGVTIERTSETPSRTVWSFGEPDTRERDMKRAIVVEFLKGSIRNEGSERQLAKLPGVGLESDDRSVFFDRMRADGILAVVRIESDGTKMWGLSKTDELRRMFEPPPDEPSQDS